VLRRPLLVTDDDALLDRLLELALAAAVEPDVARDAGSAARAWPTASVVVVDARLAEAALATGVPRRDAVVVVVPEDGQDPEVWPRALRLAAEEVVVLPAADEWLARRLAEAAAPPATARVVTVTGACGGAGASTLAAAVAVAAVRQALDVVLVDADPWGGGIDLLVGAEGARGVRWHDLAATTGRVARASVVPALPVADGLPVLAWGRGLPSRLPEPVYASVLDGLTRGGDLVVVDLGRGSPFTSSTLEHTHSLFLVTPPRVRAVAAASQLVTQAASVADARVFVRVEARHRLVDPLDVADALGLPLGGTVPRDTRRDEDEEYGVPPGLVGRGGLARLGAQLVGHVGAGRAA
jgi:secretion/DNA translocation related CpaE-like protein